MSGIFWLCFSISGAAALAFEVLWMRSAGLVLGATAPTAATVLACYFAGLGLGAAGARHMRWRSNDISTFPGTVWTAQRPLHPVPTPGVATRWMAYTIAARKAIEDLFTP